MCCHVVVKKQYKASDKISTDGKYFSFSSPDHTYYYHKNFNHCLLQKLTGITKINSKITQTPGLSNFA